MAGRRGTTVAPTVPESTEVPEVPEVPQAAGAATCGCALQDSPDSPDSRRAVAVDADGKARNLTRLRRIEGQVRGLQKMVDEDRYCADIMTQISSVHEALRSVGRELMRNHLKHCAATAIRSGGADADAMYDELVTLLYKHSR
jgi:DNA-binding FrmR family transcriptional regulator